MDREGRHAGSVSGLFKGLVTFLEEFWTGYWLQVKVAFSVYSSSGI